MSSTQFNIKDAAKLYGISRNTIYKALADGKISKTSNGTIDLVELLRVFGEPRTEHAQNKDENTAKNTIEHNKTQDYVLQEHLFELQMKAQELASARREMEFLREQLEDAKNRESFYQSQLQSLTEAIKLIEPPKSEVKEVTPLTSAKEPESEAVGLEPSVESEQKRQSFWQRLNRWW